jgi:hypothetical protein
MTTKITATLSKVIVVLLIAALASSAVLVVLMMGDKVPARWRTIHVTTVVV